jgi:hypothetical protein
MLFNCSLQSSGSPLIKLLSGNTLGECVAYLEGAGDTILGITALNINLIPNNISSEDSYTVTLKDNVSSVQSNYLIYDTYANVNSWIDNQSGKSVLNIGYQKRQFVQI